jgi:hypothetical protein
MQTLVPMMAALALVISMIITGIPGSAAGAGRDNVSAASWPHTIAAV